MSLIDTLSDEPALGNHLASIATRLADEGVPIRAISRAMQAGADPVRRTLHDALARGQITQLPREDWPPGTLRDERLPDSVSEAQNDSTLVLNCIYYFKITKLQARVLAVLIKRPRADRDTLHAAIEHGRPDKNPERETNPKMIDVVICHLRKRLVPWGLTIKTVWSSGYYMEQEDRKKAQDLLIKFIQDNPQEAVDKFDDE
jgi:hypothetical protein